MLPDWSVWGAIALYILIAIPGIPLLSKRLAILPRPEGVWRRIIRGSIIPFCMFELLYLCILVWMLFYTGPSLHSIVLVGLLAVLLILPAAAIAVAFSAIGLAISLPSSMRID